MKTSTKAEEAVHLLEKTAGTKVRIIHVVRNPFVNIATMVPRNEKVRARYGEHKIKVWSKIVICYMICMSMVCQLFFFIIYAGSRTYSYNDCVLVIHKKRLWVFLAGAYSDQESYNFKERFVFAVLKKRANDKRSSIYQIEWNYCMYTFMLHLYFGCALFILHLWKQIIASISIY